MLYWECKRRLAVLRKFRMQAVDYFENIEYAGWMAGGAPPRMNETAQKARHYMNRVLGDVLVSLSRLNVPHVVYYQPPPRLGGYAQNVDIILNVFSLWEFQIGPERVFDCVDRGIGAYERECEKLFRKLFNPLYWLGMLMLQFLRLPSKLRGTGGNDVPGTDQSLFGSIRQGWAGWNRADRLGLVAIVVAVGVGVSAVVIPELRLMLHLDKTVTAPVEPSPAQVAPAQTKTPPAQDVPAQTKPVKRKPVTTPPTPQKIEINAPGGIPIVGNQGTVNNPTVNNFGPPPPPTPTVTICVTHPTVPEGTERKTVLTFKTDVEIMEAWYALFFDGPVGVGSAEMPSGSYGYTYGRADKMPNPEKSFVFRNTSINFGVARWLPNSPMKVTVPSKDPVNLVKVLSGSGENGRDEVFVYRCE